MRENDRLKRVLAYIREKGWTYKVTEEDGCGSIDFEYRGVSYHIWEFHDGEWGADTNVRNGGGMEELTGDYEAKILEILENCQ